MEPSKSSGPQNDERRYYGKYRGIVVNVEDPPTLGRVKCRVPEVLGNLVTDWATPTDIPYGGLPESGDFVVPEVGSGVFVEFESGDVNRPLYGGVWYGQPSGKAPEPPQLTRDTGKTKFSDDPSTKSPKGDDKFTSADCSQQEQPKSPAAPRYPFNRVIKTKNNGITIEIDDTPGKGRVQIWHGPSKSWFELDKDGQLSVRVADKAYTLIEKDNRLHVVGGHHVRADGNLAHWAGQDRFLRSGGKDTVVIEGERLDFVNGGVKKVVKGSEKNWTIGDRTDVVLGNYKQYVVGKLTVNVYGMYSRLAMGAIEDAAPGIFHRGGGPSGSPPSPPSPPVCGS